MFKGNWKAWRRCGWRCWQSALGWLLSIPIFFLLIPIYIILAIPGVVAGAIPGAIAFGIASLFGGGPAGVDRGGLVAAPFLVLVAFAPLVLIGAWFHVYSSNAWTLTYREIKTLNPSKRRNLGYQSLTFVKPTKLLAGYARQEFCFPDQREFISIYKWRQLHFDKQALHNPVPRINPQCCGEQGPRLCIHLENRVVDVDIVKNHVVVCSPTFETLDGFTKAFLYIYRLGQDLFERVDLSHSCPCTVATLVPPGQRGKPFRDGIVEASCRSAPGIRPDCPSR